MAGAHVESTWEVGSDITFTGTVTNFHKKYKDRGTVLAVEREKFLQRGRIRARQLLLGRCAQCYEKSLGRINRLSCPAKKDKLHFSDERQIDIISSCAA
jgi:hypothetical protein